MVWGLPLDWTRAEERIWRRHQFSAATILWKDGINNILLKFHSQLLPRFWPQHLIQIVVTFFLTTHSKSTDTHFPWTCSKRLQEELGSAECFSGVAVANPQCRRNLPLPLPVSETPTNARNHYFFTGMVCLLVFSYKVIPAKGKNLFSFRLQL